MSFQRIPETVDLKYSIVSDEKETLNSHIERNPKKYFMALFILGVINNLGYTIVLSTSSSIAEEFDKKSMMGFFLLFMRFAGVITRYANGACCVNIKHIKRVIVVAVMSASSLLVLAYSLNMSKYPVFFWVAIVASMF